MGEFRGRGVLVMDEFGGGSRGEGSEGKIELLKAGGKGSRKMG